MYKKSHFDEKKVLYKVLKLVKKLCGLFDPTRPGALTLGLNSAIKPTTSLSTKSQKFSRTFEINFLLPI
jgi:hypothetical protein